MTKETRARLGKLYKTHGIEAYKGYYEEFKEQIDAEEEGAKEVSKNKRGR